MNCREYMKCGRAPGGDRAEGFDACMVCGALIEKGAGNCRNCR